MIRWTLSVLLAGVVLAAAAPTSTLAAHVAAPTLPIADGKTPTLTPDGTWIVPPEGSPMLLIRADPNDVTIDADALPWGPQPIDLANPVGPGTPIGGPGGEGDFSTQSHCTGASNYRAGWYETNDGTIWGGHMGVIPRNLPPDTSDYCSGTGMGYTDGVSFGTNNWIQAGLAVLTGETSAKWFCQSNDNGVLDTRYGTANAYGNGATVYTWFARDSAGTWRTYRYDTGPYAVELGCTISRNTSGVLQTFGEIQQAFSTSAPMGPWDMFDLRYLDTNNQWYVPTQVQAFYGSGTPCPPYGAGTVSSGYLYAGSGRACTTTTSAYPN